MATCFTQFTGDAVAWRWRSQVLVDPGKLRALPGERLLSFRQLGLARCLEQLMPLRVDALPARTRRLNPIAARPARIARGQALGHNTLRAPKVEGTEAVGSKDAPALYFGATKVNNNFDVVDAVGKEDGQGMTATLFVKGGDEFIRVSTSVPKPDGSGRAIGTVLAGPALESIKAGKAHYGEVPILGTPYMMGYEPIRDGSGAIIGVYYVGYKK
jgi:Cache 3/Cache 2 fusion domain